MQYSVLLAAVASAALTPLCNNPSDTACNIDAAKYLGSWYEIGRTSIIRNTFENNCNCVKAIYNLKPDGKNVEVNNKCVNPQSLALTEILGNAAIIAPGQLKVSFGDSSLGGQIGQFFQNLIPGANYNVKNVWVDEQGNYKRALVTYGKSLPAPFQFTWILSRDAVISDDEIKTYLDYARKAGFNPSGAGFERTPCSPLEREINP